MAPVRLQQGGEQRITVDAAVDQRVGIERSRGRRAISGPRGSDGEPFVLLELPIDVVLAGGVFRTTDAAFYAVIERRLGAAAPRAHTVRLAAPPVTGAVLLALDRLGLTPDARIAARLRRALVRWDARQGRG